MDFWCSLFLHSLFETGLKYVPKLAGGWQDMSWGERKGKKLFAPVAGLGFRVSGFLTN